MAGDGFLQPTLVNADGIHLRYNEEVILDGVTLTVHQKQRIGLVGRNGAGKSTFLKIISGELKPDDGQLNFRKELIVGNLPQEFHLDESASIQENILKGACHVTALIEEFEKLSGDSDRHEILERRIAALDGWNLENRIETALTHLGLSNSERRVGNLSGGEQRRVALCRAFVSNPDLLILDEPTNHLDQESIEWMTEFLLQFQGAFLLVTHDRWFLDRVTSDIVELSRGRFYSYKGNYTDYLIAAAQRQEMENTLDKKRRSFIRRELDWVRRGPKARTTKSKSRLDRFYEAADQQAPEPVLDMELIIPPPSKFSSRVLDLIQISKSIEGQSLVSNLDFRFEAGMRIGIVGRSGAGKTTLLKMMLGELIPDQGSVRAGTLTRFNYIDQTRLLLNPEHTLYEEVGGESEFVIYGNGKIPLRSYLKRFQFGSDRIDMKVKYLSGGEKSRLLLAKILKDGGNFLLFDEPTNDLDLQTLRILEEALIHFSKGCVVVVSHDRYLLNRVCTGMLVFEENGSLTYSEGDYEYYLEKKSGNAKLLSAAQKKKKTDSSERKRTEGAPRARKLTWNEQKELEGIEERILEAEANEQRLEEQFSLPDFHQRYGAEIPRLTLGLEQAKKKTVGLYARWEELEKLRIDTASES
jgi:ATP-binding cassette subfamily F protein uup